MSRITTIIATLLFSQLTQADEFDIRGYLGIEQRVFFEDAVVDGKTQYQSSINAEPELYWAWDRDNSVTFKPYFRLDSADSERTHGDVRELMYLHVNDGWELRAGIGKVFWGVTETVHLVDVINQNDTVEAIDGEDKLGQPMVQLSLLKDWGVLDLFVLPGFRERIFPGRDGRLAGQVPINQDAAQYESDEGQNHIDFAANWRYMFDDVDVSLNWFNGTSREPYLLLNESPEVGPEGELIPFYPQITQFGAVAQYVYQDWLWKLESVNRAGDFIDDHNAIVGGFEYTLVGLAGSYLDLGLIAEYAWDERGADSFQVVAQNDISVAARLTFNDIDSSELLLGFTQDLDRSGSLALFAEGSTRIGESGSLNIDVWLFSADDLSDPVYAYRSDDFLQISYQYYF
ncbi:hypothetical protein [Gayadomonas joobiniege]|uniref:hypothetical protein n=1 Tax=Gayadomonas joobiniege TaxID=1234606 RepID=UPI00037563AB|nr:hypothetical protein [Gayadomonas joobiniege]